MFPNIYFFTKTTKRKLIYNLLILGHWKSSEVTLDLSGFFVWLQGRRFLRDFLTNFKVIFLSFTQLKFQEIGVFLTSSESIKVEYCSKIG